jgi:tungstate transport system substrate-binding protein
MKRALLFLVVLFSFTLPSCKQKKSIVFATTTSVQDSGLLDELIPLFETNTGMQVKTIAVGSGKAMALGRRGEVDIILAHSPADEEAFMKEGFGMRRRAMMHNDFIIVGPVNDPAGVQSCHGAEDAFRAIARNLALFISRGDNSGTHALEKQLWKKCGIHPDTQSWYQECGLGMGETLSIASEKKAYTLTDRSSWIALKKNLSLALLWDSKGTLANVYHVIEINPARLPNVKSQDAALFAEFLLSQNVKNIIASFGKNRYSEALFRPNFTEAANGK